MKTAFAAAVLLCTSAWGYSGGPDPRFTGAPGDDRHELVQRRHLAAREDVGAAGRRRVFSIDGPAVVARFEALLEQALRYMDLKPGQKMTDLKIDVVFVGSCTNGRLADFRAAAKIAKGRKVNANVRALVVPGSAEVKKLAEAEGLGVRELYLTGGEPLLQPEAVPLMRALIARGHEVLVETGGHLPIAPLPPRAPILEMRRTYCRAQRGGRSSAVRLGR